MPFKPTLFFAALAFVGMAAHAQSQAPGLWEATMKFNTGDGQMEKGLAEMQKRLAAMPPDQRAQAEAMMAKSGVTFNAAGTAIKVCITPEQAARREPQMPGNCSTSQLERSASSMKFKYECGAPNPSRGEGEWTFTGDKAYVGHLVSTREVAGKPKQFTIDTSGKWVAADCGAVKPFVMPTDKTAK